MSLLQEGGRISQATPKSIEKSAPSVSLIVCTRNNPKTLIRDAIGSIYPSDRMPETNHSSVRELIIIDQSTSNDTKEALENSGFKNDPKAQYIPMNATGLSRARNLAVQEARGDVLAFIDDDIKISKDHVLKVAQHFLQNPQMAVMYGPVLPDSEVYQKLIAQNPQRNWNTTIPAFQPTHEYTLSNPTPREAIKLGIGANMAFRREDALKHPFDHTLGAGAYFQSHEEIDFTVRMGKEGSIEIFTDPSVVHTGARSGDEVKALMNANAKGSAAFVVKYARLNHGVGDFLSAITPLEIMKKTISSLAHTGKPSGVSQLITYYSAFLEAAKKPIDLQTESFKE